MGLIQDFKALEFKIHLNPSKFYWPRTFQDVQSFGVRRNSFESFIGHKLFKMYKALEFEEIHLNPSKFY